MFRIFFKSIGYPVIVLFFLFSSCSIEVDHIPIDSIQEHVNLIKKYQEKGKNEDLFESYEKLLNNNPDIGDEPFIYYYLSLVENDNHYFKEGLKKFPKDPELNYKRISSTSKDSIPIILKNILNENPTHLPSLRSLLKSEIYEFIQDTVNDSDHVFNYKKEINELTYIINRYTGGGSFSDSLHTFLISDFFNDLYEKLDRKISIIRSNPTGKYYQQWEDCVKRTICVVDESVVEIFVNGTWSSNHYRDGRLVKSLTGKWFMKSVPENRFLNPKVYDVVLFQYDNKGISSIRRKFSVFEYENGRLTPFDGKPLINKLNPFYGIEKDIRTKVKKDKNYLSSLYETYKSYSNDELVFDKDKLIEGVLTSDFKSVLDLQRMEFITGNYPFLERPIYRGIRKKNEMISLKPNYIR